MGHLGMPRARVCLTLETTTGRRASAKFTEIYQIESDFAAKVESEFNQMIHTCSSPA